MRIAGSTALVTGGGSGLGSATARLLAAKGARVVVADRDKDLAAGSPMELGPAPVRRTVTSRPTTSWLTSSRGRRQGPLRAVVHCAGAVEPVRIMEAPGVPGRLEDLTDVVALHHVGTYNVLQHAAAAMATNDMIDEGRGVCVLTASIAAFEGQLGQIAYSSSKAGAVGMTLVAARELAPSPIRVCTIAQGFFDTAMMQALPPASLAKLRAAITTHPWSERRRQDHDHENGAALMDFFTLGRAKLITIATQAKVAEQDGWDGLLVADSQNAGGDAFTALALAAAATRNLQVGPG